MEKRVSRTIMPWATVTKFSLDLDSPIWTSCRQAIKCPLISDSPWTTSTSGALGLLALWVLGLSLGSGQICPCTATQTSASSLLLMLSHDNGQGLRLGILSDQLERKGKAWGHWYGSFRGRSRVPCIVWISELDYNLCIYPFPVKHN